MSDGPQIAIIGTVGVPARYGGFETLAEALLRGAEARALTRAFTVYCSAPQASEEKKKFYRGARLRYLPLRANGVQSIVYDALSLALAAASKTDTALVLGVSGAVSFPLLRALCRMRIVVHVDGIEWRRAKWGGFARVFLRWSERLAVRWAHEVIADNAAIAAYLRDRYGIEPVEIAYGGDQAVAVDPADVSDLGLPRTYALAIARIEPENNITMMLNAFAAHPDLPLVLIGNWDASFEAQALRARYAAHASLYLLDPIYDQARLRMIREGAAFYIHGHSAGGTNPALVEMMHIGRPIAAFNGPFNRATTEDRAAFFQDEAALRALVADRDAALPPDQGEGLKEIALRRYRWADVTAQYFRLLRLTP